MTLSLLAILTSSFIILIFASCSLFLPLIFSKSYSSCFSYNISWGSDDPVDIYSLIYRMFSSVMYINVNKFFYYLLIYIYIFFRFLFDILSVGGTGVLNIVKLIVNWELRNLVYYFFTFFDCDFVMQRLVIFFY